MPRVIRISLALIGLMASLHLMSTQAQAQSFADPTAISPKLFIHGGGGINQAVDKEFFELAGGENAKLVVIPTATSDKNIPTIVQLRKRWSNRGFENVTLFHTRDRTQANDPEFLKQLDGVTAIWLSGGIQQRIADAYVGTNAEERILEIARSGAVIGGSSAGAAIQTKVMIQSGKDSPNLSTGFDLLQNSIVDQHFLKRSRINRLMSAVRQNPKLTGFGIDEGTALIVTGNSARVVGESYVVVIRIRQDKMEIRSFSPGSTFALSPEK